MVESQENFFQRKSREIKKGAARAFLATVLAGAGARGSVEGQSSSPEDYLTTGKILLYNLTEEHGGSMGFGGLVEDPETGEILLCTAGHVVEQGLLLPEVFTESLTDGDDPILCAKADEGLGHFENVPVIFRDELKEGDEIILADREHNPVEFVVTRADYEEDKVWFSPKDENAWEPGSGDSGSLFVNLNGEAPGVFGGRSVKPNRENPDQPIVEFYMIPFRNTE